MKDKIYEILRENANDIQKAKLEIQALTKQNFTIHQSNGELFVEFDDPTDTIDNGYKLLEE